MKLYLPAGYGYWNTVHYPIGGSFRRTMEDKPVRAILREFKLCYGCNCEVVFEDGTTGAVRESALRETK